MNHQKVAEILSSIEERIDVNSFWIDGVQIWPLLRRDIWIYLLGLPDIEDRNNLHYSRQIEETGSDYLDGRYRFRNDGDIHLVSQLKSKLTCILSCKDVLFWSRKEDHTENFKNGTVDRIIDPMIWFARNEGLTTLKLSRGSGTSWREIKQLEESIKLPVDSLHGPQAGEQSRGSAEKLLDEILKIIPYLPFTGAHILSAVRRLNSRADYFDIVLDIVKPRLVMLGVFYSPDALALIHACRKRKIPTVDIQHGKQGLYHAMYGFWNVLPPKGYSVLPDYFWTWGRASSQLVLSCRRYRAVRPEPVTGGNRWLALWKRESEPIALSPETGSLLAEIKNFNRVILVTLQPLQDPLSHHLLIAMEQSPPEWYWMIRTHPHQRGELDTIEDRIKATGLKLFDVRRASNAPLYPLLKRADLHVTRWSSVAFEALALEKPTVLIDETGLKLYRDYVNQGLFSHANTVDELTCALSALPGASSPEDTESYIETGDNLAITALKKCIKKQWLRNNMDGLWYAVRRRFLTSVTVASV